VLELKLNREDVWWFYPCNSLQQFGATKTRIYSLTSCAGTNVSLYLTSLHTYCLTHTHISPNSWQVSRQTWASPGIHMHACLHKNTHSSERESALFCGFVLVWCKTQVSLALVCLVNTRTHRAEANHNSTCTKSQFAHTRWMRNYTTHTNSNITSTQ